MKTKTTITFETRQLTIVRKRTKAGQFWCERCAVEVETLSPDEVAKISGNTQCCVSRQVENEAAFRRDESRGSSIFRIAESGQTHSRETL